MIRIRIIKFSRRELSYTVLLFVIIINNYLKEKEIFVYKGDVVDRRLEHIIYVIR